MWYTPAVLIHRLMVRKTMLPYEAAGALNAKGRKS